MTNKNHEVTNSLLLKVLGGQTDRLKGLRSDNHALKLQLHAARNEVNALRNDMLRFERTLMINQEDVEKIKDKLSERD